MTGVPKQVNNLSRNIATKLQCTFLHSMRQRCGIPSCLKCRNPMKQRGSEQVYKEGKNKLVRVNIRSSNCFTQVPG